MKKNNLYIALSVALFVFATFTGSAQKASEIRALFEPVADSVESYLAGRMTSKDSLYVEKCSFNSSTKSATLYFSHALADTPLRESDIQVIKNIVTNLFPDKYNSYRNKVTIISNDHQLETLAVPMLGAKFKTDNQLVTYQLPSTTVKEHSQPRAAYPLTTNESAKNKPSKGLNGRHIALWQSHGYYYDRGVNSWQWQRARFFGTVEDLLTESFVLPYLTPMLENAGANVMLPRERDVQIHELLVDNDIDDGNYKETNGLNKWQNAQQAGYKPSEDPLEYMENPFEMGSYRVAQSVEYESDASWIEYVADLPETGEYAVYVSYGRCSNPCESVRYEVRHAGGTTRFRVNQSMGAGTWIYLGTFGFYKNRRGQGVFLNNVSEKSGQITADAVKFGGGMGSVNRKRRKESSDSTFVAISGYPRFMEGARYWLQTAGFSEKVYSETKNKDDYRDDYMSRGLWVNALAGGSSRNPFQDGYNIPIDVAFALHSDAGFSQTDTITGTLGIYRVLSDGKQRYIYGGKRDIARSMTDMIQSQVVNDIRHKIAPEWTRREIWDRSYLEARLAEVPTVLLELLSHQNIADMRYGLDPEFKFIVSRAIYKGILKFVAGINGQPYVVQPLPVNSFAIDADFALNNVVNLKWRPTLDSLESSAKPSSYIVYTRVTDLDKYEDNISAIGSGIFGFDEGIVVSDTTFSLSLQPGKLYSFKVTAVNQGGESFPSEILSAGIVDGRTKSTKSVMVVNNYTRVAPAAYFGIQDSLKSGFLYQLDSGSPYLRDFSFTGNQTDFDRKSEFINNDDPGFGGSASDYETMVIAGNSFDFPAKHGAAIMRAGYNFVSSSMQAVADGGVKLKKYAVVDLICGKQIKTPKGNGRIAYPVFPSNLQTVLADYLSGGKALLVSGAYVGTDSHENIYDLKFDDNYFKKVLKPEQLFAEEILHFRWVANLRGSDGIVDVQNNRLEFNQNTFDFKTSPNSDSYSVESPDVISPVGFRASSIMKYRQTGTSAGVLYKGLSYKTVTLGFPLESLSSQSQIDRLTADLLRILTE